MLRKGNKVGVYQKPLTKEKYEGDAILVEKIQDDEDWDGYKFEYWKVQFIAGDWDQLYYRIVSDRDKIL